MATKLEELEFKLTSKSMVQWLCNNLKASGASSHREGMCSWCGLWLLRAVAPLIDVGPLVVSESLLETAARVEQAPRSRRP